MTSPISSVARDWVRQRATEVMEYTCQISRGDVPALYDENTLAYTPAGDKEVVYEGVCRVWEVANTSTVVIGDVDVYQQTTNLSIPWNESPVIKRGDEVEILSAPTDSQMVGKRFEVQSIARAGELRATRRFMVTAVM